MNKTNILTLSLILAASAKLEALAQTEKLDTLTVDKAISYYVGMGAGHSNISIKSPLISGKSRTGFNQEAFAGAKVPLGKKIHMNIAARVAFAGGDEENGMARFRKEDVGGTVSAVGIFPSEPYSGSSLFGYTELGITGDKTGTFIANLPQGLNDQGPDRLENTKAGLMGRAGFGGTSGANSFYLLFNYGSGIIHSNNGINRDHELSTTFGYARTFRSGQEISGSVTAGQQFTDDIVFGSVSHNYVKFKAAFTLNKKSTSRHPYSHFSY